jgi:hypothetical protein
MSGKFFVLSSHHFGPGSTGFFFFFFFLSQLYVSGASG